MHPKAIRTENAVWFLTKIFVVFGVSFALLTGSYDYFARGHTENLWFRRVFFGGMMTVVIGLPHLLRARRFGVAGALSVNQAATATIAVPVNVAVKAAESVLARMRARSIRTTRDGVPVILARMPISFRSFGERVRVSFASTSEGSVRVDVQSRPWLRTTICDYGKNLENIEVFLDRFMTDSGGIEPAS